MRIYLLQLNINNIIHLTRENSENVKIFLIVKVFMLFQAFEAL